MRLFCGAPAVAYAAVMNVVELRRYALKSGRRDDLIDLFEREFVHSQEACGITLLGRYRDVDEPDSFVWFRAFPSMDERRNALEAFYLHSPAWLQHRDAANDTMVDSDNVLLLRPARPDSGFQNAGVQSGSTAAVSIFMLDAPADEAYIQEFERGVLPALREIARSVSYFVTESSPNTFPRLPVREGEWAFVVAGLCDDGAAVDAWHRTYAAPERLRLIGTSYRR
jgi:hypothetical protein